MKNKMGMILIILLLVILLVLFAVGFAFLYKAMNKTNEGGEANVTTQQVLAIEDITPFSVGEPIVTNLLKGPDNKEHVIKISVNLGVNTSKEVAKDGEALLSTLETQRVVVKDTIVGICSNKTYEELSVSDARTLLKNEILVKMQEVFATDLIVDVYIDEMFTQ